MDIRKLQRAIVDGLEDVKGQHIAVFNTEHLSSLFERVIIASGTSNRQTKALAASVRDSVKSQGMPVLATEGEDNGEWIIVDCGAAVAHIMQPAIREYYHLEEIWGGKTVRMKVGEVSTKLVKASEPQKLSRSNAAKTAYQDALKADKIANPKPPARKRASTGTAAKGVAAKTAPARRAAVKSPAARGPSAKPASSPRGAPAARGTGARPAKAAATSASRPSAASPSATPGRAAPRARPPAKKTITTKVIARKTPARKAAAGKTPARKAPARKTPTR